MSQQIKSRKRVAEHGEVFTSEREVSAMVNLVQEETRQMESRFLEPACGDGNFLAEILYRKLAAARQQSAGDRELFTQKSLQALASLYGIDIQEDNVRECRNRLYGIWESAYTAACTAAADETGSAQNSRNTQDIRDVRPAAKTILERNILCGNALTLKLGSGQSIRLPEWELQRGKYSGGMPVVRKEYVLGELLHAEQTQQDAQSTQNEQLSLLEPAGSSFGFDVIISNPPYQIPDGGAQASAAPVYQHFVERAIELEPKKIVMIIPSRWFTAGKNLSQFRRRMLHDDRIRVIHDFIDASECFSGVEIKGGVNYFLWERDYHGTCLFVTHANGKPVSQMQRPLLESGCDVLIRYNEAISILRKVQGHKETSFATKVHSAMCFGFRTFFKDFDSEVPGESLVKVYANHAQGYIWRSRIQRNPQYIDEWKVIVPEAFGSGDVRTSRAKPIICEPGSINTETYVMNGPWESEEQARNVAAYIQTKFFHFLMGLKKITQHTTFKVYEFVPLQDFSRTWTDRDLYAKYQLSPEETAFIENSVWPDQKS